MLEMGLEALLNGLRDAMGLSLLVIVRTLADQQSYSRENIG
jgi:hypothetical protein